MEIHFLDILVYIIISAIFFGASGTREGLESLGPLMWWVLFTIVYIVLFGFIDYNITDLITISEFKISL